MAFVEKQLAQAEGTGTVTSVYSPATGVRAIIKVVTLCNTTSNDVTFSLYRDDDGTTYDDSTAQFKDAVLGANKTFDKDTFWPMSQSTGNIAFKGDGITITLDGAEITN
tara:strand:+ start:1000 stop:1326 length:327 start_codon:yes stop_codon:yes gene_type:complete